MNHNTIDDFRRSQHQKAVKIQVSPAAAASPSCLLIPDRNLPVSHTHLWGIIGHSLRNYLQCLIRQFLYFLHRPHPGLRILLPLLLHQFLMLLYPVRMLDYKPADFPLRKLLRNPYITCPSGFTSSPMLFLPERIIVTVISEYTFFTCSITLSFSQEFRVYMFILLPILQYPRGKSNLKRA